MVLVVLVVSLMPHLIEAGVRNAITLQRFQSSAVTQRDSNERIETLSNWMIEYFPHKRFGYRMLGFSLVEQGEVEQAISVWRNLDGMSVELFHLGQQARRMGRYGDARLWYSLVEQLSPGQLSQYEERWPLYYYPVLEKDIPSIPELLARPGVYPLGNE